MTVALSGGPDDDVSHDDHWRAQSSTIFITAVEVLGYIKRNNANGFNEQDDKRNPDTSNKYSSPGKV